MKFEDCMRAFHIDGSLRDILIFNTNIDDWEKLFNLVRTYPCELRFLQDGELGIIPVTAPEVFRDTEQAHSISIDIDDITIVAHFFGIDEMELDIDPREIKSQSQFDQLAEFVISLGRKLEKDVVITEESTPEKIWFRYSFKKDKLNFSLPNKVQTQQIKN